MANTEPPFSRGRMWPFYLLLIAELAALLLIHSYNDPPVFSQITRFSGLVALLVLMSGVLPAVLKPARETLIAGCLATILASIYAFPFSSQDLPRNFFEQTVISSAEPFLILRLVNGICIGPLAFHLAARFPVPAAISGRNLAAIYGISFGLLTMLLLVGVNTVRIFSALALLVWSGGLVIGAMVLLLLSSRRVNPENPRPAQQARLLFIAVTLAAIPALLRPLGLAVGIDIIPYSAMLAAQVLIPLGVAYAILRHDLFGIDSLMRRALAYAILSLLVLVIYFGLTVGLTALLISSAPGMRRLATLIALFAAALAFEPARRQLQGWIDRALYPDRLNFYRAVATARETLSVVVSRQQIIDLLTMDLPSKLGAGWGSLHLGQESETLDQAEAVWSYPLIVAGRQLGVFRLGPRRYAPGFDAEETAQLKGLIGQSALALAYADTIDELQSLNRELEGRVAQRTSQVLAQQRALAAYDERQRLARELHDSITQSLFSMNLSARALRNLLRKDLDETEKGLWELERTIQQTLTEMRSLLAQLRSAASETVDLLAWLRDHCAQLSKNVASGSSTGRLYVDLDAPPELHLPAGYAHELMQIIREALHNIVKHSGCDRASLQIFLEDDRLWTIVQDYGLGFNPQEAASNGFGLRGIQERLALLEGTLEIQSSPGEGSCLKIITPIPFKTEIREAENG